MKGGGKGGRGDTFRGRGEKTYGGEGEGNERHLKGGR